MQSTDGYKKIKKPQCVAHTLLAGLLKLNEIEITRRNRRGTVKPYNVSSSRLLMYMFLTKLSKSDSLKVV